MFAFKKNNLFYNQGYGHPAASYSSKDAVFVTYLFPKECKMAYNKHVYNRALKIETSKP